MLTRACHRITTDSTGADRIRNHISNTCHRSDPQAVPIMTSSRFGTICFPDRAINPYDGRLLPVFYILASTVSDSSCFSWNPNHQRRIFRRWSISADRTMTSKSSHTDGNRYGTRFTNILVRRHRNELTLQTTEAAELPRAYFNMGILGG